MENCSECTYLNTSNQNLYGKYWCELHEKYVFLNNSACEDFSWETARQSFLNDEYDKYLKNSHNSCFSISTICSILKMPRQNQFVENIKNLRNKILASGSGNKKAIYEIDVMDLYIQECINKDPLKERISFDLFFKYIQPINELIKAQKYGEAVDRYVHMTQSLKNFYKIDNIEVLNKIKQKA